MKLDKFHTFLLLAVFVSFSPVWAEEPAKQVGDNASETGKNEIPICPKLVPITVAISPEYPEADRIEVMNKYEVPKRIEYAIACELDRQGYSAAKLLELKVTIKSFRLRSGGSAVALGVMAGVDILGVAVDVLAKDQAHGLQFDTKASNAKGGFTMPVTSQRINIMVQKIAKDVVGKIKKKGLFTEA